MGSGGDKVLSNNNQGPMGLNLTNSLRNASRPSSWANLNQPHFRCSFLIVLSTILIETLGCSIQTSSVDTTLEGLLSDMHRRINLINQLRVDFTMIRHSSSFKSPVSIKGTLVYQKPAKFIMTYQGGVNLQVLSDNSVVRLVHDGGFTETFVLNRDRNSGVFCAPWIDLITTIGTGEFDKLFTVALTRKDELLELGFATKNQRPFEHVKLIRLYVNDFGEVKHITVVFSDEDFDEIHFDSWSILLDTDPEIVDLEAKLKTISVN